MFEQYHHEPREFNSIEDYRAHLLPDDLIDQFEETGKQSSDNPLVLAKYYIPSSLARWYATEYRDGIFRGFVCMSDFGKWGGFKLSAVEALYEKGEHTILRDETFTPKPFSEAVHPDEMLCADMKEIIRYTKLRAHDASESP